MSFTDEERTPGIWAGLCCRIPRHGGIHAVALPRRLSRGHGMRMMPYAQHEHTDFTGASLQALQEPTLQTALARLGTTLAAGNRAAWTALPNSDLLRERARQIKDDALARLGELLVQTEE